MDFPQMKHNKKNTTTKHLKNKTMATRSYIGKLNQDGTVSYIYCHYDGYLEHNGKLLKENYNTPEMVNELLSLGDISYLGQEIGQQQDFSKPNVKWTIAYGRDRGEVDAEQRESLLEDFGNDMGIDYFYLYTDEGWKYRQSEFETWRLIEMETKEN